MATVLVFLDKKTKLIKVLWDRSECPSRKMGEEGTGGASVMVKMRSSGEDPMETHRLSRVAGRKCQALASYFSVRIWYVF